MSYANSYKLKSINPKILTGATTQQPLLEQKVRERTYDIEQINIDLKNQQQNLELTHEIAGIRPWDWNIKDRSILLTNHKDEKVQRKSSEHHLQLQHMIHPDDLAAFKSNMKQHLRGKTERYEVTYRIQQAPESGAGYMM